MRIRPAQERDLATITAIYNEVLTHTSAIYRDDPVTLEERREWWQSRLAQGYPVLVAEDDTQVDRQIAGFASFGDFRLGSGYRFTVEGTIHLAHHARRQGIGTLLFHALLDHARALGIHTLVAGADSENTGSLAFLEKLGFRRTAYMPQVGFKFGRFLDLVLLQYPIS